MVLRKRAPPHLYSLSQGNARSESHSSVSQASPTSFSVSSPSPKRLTRPRRAQSSPHPRRIPSQESVYSPDLNTSPAFALMSLEQAQRSPIRTSSTDTPNPWADELIEKPNQSHNDIVDSGTLDGEVVDTKKGDRVPPIVLAGTQRRMAANEWQTNQGLNEASDWEYLAHPPVQLQSNNPFLKASQPEKPSWEDRNSHTSRGSSLSRDDASRGLGQDEGYIPMTARLSLFDQPDAESPWANEPGHPAAQHQLSPHYEYDGPYQETSTMPFQEHHSVLDANDETYSQLHPQQIPLQTGRSTPGTISTATTGSSHVLIEIDEPPRPELGTGSSQTPLAFTDQFANETGEHQPSLHRAQIASGPSLSDTNQDAGSTASPNAQPPVNAPISGDEEKKQQEKRSETYSIRHINWQDYTGQLQESPVLVQNKNGPCPLLALVNALVLRAANQSSPPPIVRALQTREQISLGLLIEALFDELTTHLGPDEEFPDIEALSRFLTMLHTGMNVNPRLTLESNDMVGTFLQTGDIKFYSTFGVPLVHGWIASPSSKANTALARIGQYHEDIQLLPFRKQELEDRVFQGASLTLEEETAMADIQAIQQFTDFENATQLSPFGLEHLKKTLQPGSLSILFRNDHFSTLYKHPRLHQLFSLVTDAGYSNHAEVVWESLVDVNGSNTGFFAGDFRVVSHHAPRDPDPSGPRTSSHENPGNKPPLSPQEQADADYAYALSLQYQEEEERGNDRTAHRASAPHLSPGVSRTSNVAHSRSSSAVNVRGGTYPSPVGTRTSRQRQSYGHNSQSHFDTSRPAHDDSDDAPPPSYEQAAQSPAYPSPQRSPNFMDPPPQSPYQRNQYGRRPVGAPLSAALQDRGRERNKDCIVM